jgi:acetyl/propionyl-CoA carboxylase alpha subunit
MGGAAAAPRRGGLPERRDGGVPARHDGRFYFLEVNTRLQVEHPITELVTGIDLVRSSSGWRQARRSGMGRPRWPSGLGHRVPDLAEDPAAGFIPSPGRITTWRPPAGAWVRVDAGVYEGGEVPLHYDP